MSSMIPRLLLKLRPHAFGPFRRVLTRLWATRLQPVQVRVHGYDVTLNGGNTYPLIVQDHRWFNAPLVELCHQSFLVRGAPITLVDVGAATGDSVLLIKRRCPGAVDRFVCVEGDAEFHEILTQNMSQFGDVVILKALLASAEKNIPSLVKHHRGTAAAIGTEQAKAVRLDSLRQVTSPPARGSENRCRWLRWRSPRRSHIDPGGTPPCGNFRMASQADRESRQ